MTHPHADPSSTLRTVGTTMGRPDQTVRGDRTAVRRARAPLTVTSKYTSSHRAATPISGPILGGPVRHASAANPNRTQQQTSTAWC